MNHARVKAMRENSFHILHAAQTPSQSKMLALYMAACVRTGTIAFHAHFIRIRTAVPYIEMCDKCISKIITVF